MTQFTNSSDPPIGADVENTGQGVDDTGPPTAPEDTQMLTTLHIIGGEETIEHHTVIKDNDTMTQEVPDQIEQTESGDGYHDRSMTPKQMHVDPDKGPSIPSIFLEGDPPPDERSDNKALDEHTGFADNRLDYDILNEIPNMYRLLDIINDGVDKAVIHHASIRKIANKLKPGSYSSMSKIDFEMLDGSVISPVGIYGSRSKLIAWLLNSGVITEEIADRLSDNQQAIYGSCGLSPGMYLLEAATPKFYVIFWPEDRTWEARETTDAGKNRVLFMRYLTKLCDQIECHVSDEDAAKVAEIQGWNQHATVEPAPATRLYKRRVTHMVEQEENAIGVPGPSYSLNLASRQQDHRLRPHPDHPIRFVGGNERQGLLITSIQQSGDESGPMKDMTSLQVKRLLSDRNAMPSILLGPDIDHTTLKLLLGFGLQAHFSPLYDEWQSEYDDAMAKLNKDREAEEQRLSTLLPHCLPKIRAKLATLASPELERRYPLLTPLSWYDPGRSSPRLESSEQSVHNDGFVEAIFSMDDLKDRIEQHFRDFDWDQHFREQGDTASFVEDPLQRSGHMTRPATPLTGQPPDFILTRDNNVTRDHTHTQPGNRPSRREHKNSRSHKWNLPSIRSMTNWSPAASFRTLVQWPTKSTETRGISPETSSVSSPMTKASDPLSSLPSVSEQPRKEHLKARKNILYSTLTEAVDLAVDIVTSMRWQRFEREMNGLVDKENLVKWKLLASKINLELERKLKSETLMIHNAVQGKTQLYFNCRKLKKRSQETVLTLYELVLGDGGIASLRHLTPIPGCEPKSLLHIQFVGRDHLLTLTNEGESILMDQFALSNKYRHIRHSVQSDRLGPSFRFDFDESSQRLAFLTHENDLIVYESDRYKFSALPPIKLDGFPFENPGDIAHIRFLPGGKTIVVIDSNGNLALYSLTSNQFRSSRITLGATPFCVHCTPDRSCILVGTQDQPGHSVLRAYHIASFGQLPNGFTLQPHFEIMGQQLMFAQLGNSDKIHLVSLQNGEICSLELRITSKSADYRFRSSGTTERPESVASASLIHCFTEVWSRYPIVGAMEHHRKPLQNHASQVHFVTSTHHDLFVKEFAKQVKEFQRQQPKPTGRLSTLGFSATSVSDVAMECTQFYFGDWLAGLFCLIPIHIAIVNANQFVPLQDGSLPAEFDGSLAGVEVERLASGLSIGWYESIFSSYFAKKPVRVVSSMGEQSVGKSYALNHLADTSFAGSAMRCTEGAWLSVTPCDQELVVTLDFEGINSIERSKQEDMLLVLFQTAISNLVLLRSHSAMSRNLNKLLSSFQRSSTAFNSDANPTLFQSTLTLIIRDVPEADADGTVEEFDEKLGRIVKEEQDGNFISRLHRGDVVIVPWPLMSSPAFYHTFEDIKQLLLDRPAVYASGGEFLGVLKMLMAKIQACDWSAIDTSLGSQRANLLADHLIDALRYGKTNLSARGLTILDTDELLALSTTEDAVFALPSEPTERLPETLRALCEGVPAYELRLQRAEDEFVRDLGLYLHNLAENRIDLVEKWINQNTTRFQDSPDVQELYATFKAHAQTIRLQVILCGMGCGQCGRRCLNVQRHFGQHDCGTDHSCSSFCSFEEEHPSTLPSCTLPALHSGSHICREINHCCRDPCMLMGLGNCLGTCKKSINHSDEEHICNARRHTCTATCDLASLSSPESGIAVCVGKCDMDHDKPHDQHQCQQSGCPLRCALCGRRCAIDDHLHGLQQDAVHLCSDEHRCDEKCEMPGVCEVKPQPLSVEATYTGQLETFQYTLYTQQARKLRCAIPVPAGRLTHEGLHKHNEERHYCEARCSQCDYYCTLLFGHSQQEHETSHGNMKKTKWRMEGTQTIVGGRRYAGGDQGVTMICSVVCSELGRHSHYAPCRTSGDRCAGSDDVEHIPNEPATSDAPFGFDWVSHRLFWERSGFKDPYPREQQIEFSKCPRQCVGEEHRTEPSFCTLPLFHPPAYGSPVPANQYRSSDGHVFTCEDPKPPCHVIFAIDRSASMKNWDNTPQANFHDIPRISQLHNNRYGAVLVALFRFLGTIQTARLSRRGSPRDAYSCVLFDMSAQVPFVHDEVRSNEELLDILVQESVNGGTNFNNALDKIKDVMVTNWTQNRLPVVIFLSDGEDRVDAGKIRDLCETAVTLGKPLAFYSISFGNERLAGELKAMARISRAVYRAAAPNATDVPCQFREALDTVQLQDIFIEIAESLRFQRATLVPE